ncbi:MAG TPA: outer membrane beta-barrel protein [Gemmatimonadales bacterium]|jgi:hypothetical protein
MRSLSRILCIAFLLAIMATRMTLAQEEETRHKGFWFGFGGGWGSADVNCDGCASSDREGGFAGYFKLGGVLRPDLLLGVEGDSWFKHDSNLDTDEALGNLSAALYWYPKKEGLFLKGGIGAAGLRTSGPLPTVEGYGVGVILGVGYDFPVSATLSVTPVINFNYGNLGNLTADGVKTADGASFNVIQLGLGITVH